MEGKLTEHNVINMSERRGIMDFEDWLLDKYGIEDFDEYKREYDYFGTMDKDFFKEYLKGNN